MKQTLQIKLSQQLAMTPQLQQAIKLLQLSSIDLQQEIQNHLESNPLLELDEILENDHQGEASTNQSESLLSEQDIEFNNEYGNDENTLISKEIPNELPVDTSWDDIYPASTATYDLDTRTDFDAKDYSSETLHEHLLWQLNLTPMSDVDRIIALAIIDGIESDGYLKVSLSDLLESLQDLSVEEDEIIAVLHRIQQFDPSGVAARDLSECLLIQLKQITIDDTNIERAKLLIHDYLPLLASHDYAKLKRVTGLSENQLREAVVLIQSLSPRPGAQITPSKTEYIIPDVIVSKQHDNWIVELNNSVMPKIKVNTNYAALIKQNDNGADATYLREYLQEAKWLIKSIQSRNETLLKVASVIVNKQQKFFEKGPEAMQPLILQDVASILELHESTISRVTSNKFMHTPRGVFELKYFFSSHVGTAVGGECSATAVQALIKKMIAKETPNKPLSDNKIAQILQKDGINIARRTIAKYRETMAIPPSNERKRLA